MGADGMGTGSQSEKTLDFISLQLVSFVWEKINKLCETLRRSF